MKLKQISVFIENAPGRLQGGSYRNRSYPAFARTKIVTGHLGFEFSDWFAI